MSIYQLKSRFQSLLRPGCEKLAGAGVTPNQLTLAALGISLLHGTALLAFPLSPLPALLLPVTLFVRMALNALDGMLAREYNMKTPAGALLNEMGDVLSDTFLYLPFFARAGFPEQGVVLFVLLAVLSEFAGVLGPVIGSERRYDGPMGKSDRAFVFGALGLVSGFHLLSAPVGFWLFVALNLLLVLTIRNRVSGALGERS